MGFSHGGACTTKKRDERQQRQQEVRNKGTELVTSARG